MALKINYNPGSRKAYQVIIVGCDPKANFDLSYSSRQGPGHRPDPITMDEFEDILMEHGIMPQVDQTIIGKTAA